MPFSPTSVTTLKNALLAQHQLSLFTIHFSFDIEMLRNTWSTDPHFMGAYSYQVTGINDDDYAALDHPVNKSLWFTGEYTAHLDYGYAHIPLKLGGEVAGKILKCLQKNDCPAMLPKVSKPEETKCPKDTSSSDSVTYIHIKLFSLCMFVVMLNLFK